MELSVEVNITRSSTFLYTCKPYFNHANESSQNLAEHTNTNNNIVNERKQRRWRWFGTGKGEGLLK